MAASETGSAAWPGRLSGGGTTVSVIVATAIVVADMVGVGVFTAPVALAAMAFGEYGKAVLPGAPPLALAIGVVWLVSIVQLGGVRHSSTFQLISTILKVVLIVAFLIAGFVIGTPQPVSFAPQASDLAHVASAPFAIGLVFVMYSFSGWNAATYIIGEMHTPQQSLPRALLAGTLIVLVLYVALNAVFL